jgi:DNA-binding winged helix-turn-helix (wHTH) protein
MTYAFGAVRVDADARVISGTAGLVHLTRKAFDLLLLLLENRPNAVSKEQIYARVWPDTFVAESSVQFLIHEIRQAIDEPRGRQSWIRTIHGIGYSFCGELLVIGAEAASRVEHPAAWLVSGPIRVPLREGENIIGRDFAELLQLDVPTISRRHARIVIVGESITLEDIGSKNGTWFDDERLTAPHGLADGDVVKLGSATFTFRLARQSKPTESVDQLPGNANLTGR